MSDPVKKRPSPETDTSAGKITSEPVASETSVFQPAENTAPPKAETEPAVEKPEIPMQPVYREPADVGTAEPAPRKRKRRSAPHGCLVSVGYAAFILGISMIISSFLILFVNEVFAFVKPDITSVIELTTDDDFSTISSKLSEAGIIKYPTLFNLYLNIAKSDTEFSPGEYEVSAKLDYPAIARALRKGVGVRDTVRVTIPEGYTTVQIVNVLSTRGVCSAADLYEVIRNDDFDYDWIDQTGEGDLRLEGFLFPDTYEFYKDDDPHSVINKLLSNFDRRYDADLRADAEAGSFSLRDLVIIASMIEREAYLDEERPVISAVIHNRLSNPKYSFLQIDATLAYILGRAPTDNDLTIDNVYNTYLYKGLPPTPIANPGLSSLEAALYPADSDYYFYVARSDGSHIFSRTDEEHAAAVEEVSHE